MGEIITRFERVGLKLVAVKLLTLKDLIERHYPKDREELWVGIVKRLRKLQKPRNGSKESLGTTIQKKSQNG